MCYELLLAPSVAERIAERPEGSEVELFTYYYLHTDPQKSVPVLLGFETERQRDFFELLMQVPKFGPRAALKAMAVPVPTLAQAIEMQDMRLLKSLPGVGPQKAKDIIATLQGKVAAFVEASAEGEVAGALAMTEAEGDAVDLLEQLGMARAEALRRVMAARRQHPELETVESIVRAVFRQG
jgi:Holliday junction DNA helicase RuvA